MRITKQKQNGLVLQVGLDLLEGKSPDEVAEKNQMSKMTVYSYIRKEPLLNKAKLLGELLIVVKTESDDREETLMLADMSNRLSSRLNESFLEEKVHQIIENIDEFERLPEEAIQAS